MCELVHFPFLVFRKTCCYPTEQKEFILVIIVKLSKNIARHFWNVA